MILLVMGVNAQAKENRKDAIGARKVSFITKAMSLTSQEAEKFWPIFNDYEQKKETVRKDRIKARKKFEANSNLSEKQIEELIDLEVDSHNRENELMKERHRQLKKILSMKKIAMLYKAEEDFKRLLIKEVCENMNTNNKKELEE